MTMRSPFLTHLVTAFTQWMEIHKARTELHGLDDHQLADIGLRREEIDRVVIPARTVTPRATNDAGLSVGLRRAA
jgi:uncharacterized protein YjiS (DUF1127 family)